MGQNTVAIVREYLQLAEAGVASIAIRDGYAVRTSAIDPLETPEYGWLELIQTIGEN